MDRTTAAVFGAEFLAAGDPPCRGGHDVWTSVYSFKDGNELMRFVDDYNESH